MHFRNIPDLAGLVDPSELNELVFDGLTVSSTGPEEDEEGAQAHRHVDEQPGVRLLGRRLNPRLNVICRGRRHTDKTARA